MKIGNQNFEIGKRTYIMGILNITPDSFSDGGKYNDLSCAMFHTKKMKAEGMDILDIGGESTRPGHTTISAEEEIKRIIPVIRLIKRNYPDLPVSVDSYKPEVCEAAIDAGADMINDIWGFRKDSKMAEIAVKHHLPCCLMHNKESASYENFLTDFIKEMEESLTIALGHGVHPDQIILDPGIGFGKTYEQNLLLMQHLEIIKEHFSFPVLLGTSRKSMIGKALGDAPVGERIEGTVATSVIGIMKGCDFIRVHDITANKRACLMADAICRKKN